MFNTNNHRKEYLAGLTGMGGGPASLTVSAPSGVSAIDFFGMPSADPIYSDTRGMAAYDSGGNIITWFKHHDFTLVKIKPDGTVDWKRGFTTNPQTWPGTSVMSIDVGYNDITVCASYKGGTGGGIYLWGVSKTGALLWNKKYQVDYTNFNHSSLSPITNGRPSIKAMTTGDVAIICIPLYDGVGTGNGQNQTTFLTVKCTDGTKIGWGQTKPSGTDPYAMFAQTFTAYLPSGSTTGYWSIISYDGHSGGTHWYQYAKSWQLRGKFQTASHSGSKDITLSSTVAYGLHKSGGAYNGSFDITDHDCLKDSTGTNITSNCWFGGNEVYGSGTSNYRNGAYLRGAYPTTTKKFITDHHTSNMRVAVKTNNSSWDRQVFYACNNNSSGSVYKVVLTKINNDSIVWSRTLTWYTPSTYTPKNAYVRSVIVDPNGDKGLLILSYAGSLTDLILCQFDTGDTAPATGTYTFSNNGRVQVSSNSTSMSGFWTVEGWVVNVYGIRNGNADFEWDSVTDSSRTFEDKSVDLVKEEWD